MKSEHARIKKEFKKHTADLGEPLEPIEALPSHGPDLESIAPLTFASVFSDSPPVVCRFKLDDVWRISKLWSCRGYVGVVSPAGAPLQALPALQCQQRRSTVPTRLMLDDACQNFGGDSSPFLGGRRPQESPLTRGSSCESIGSESDKTKVEPNAESAATLGQMNGGEKLTGGGQPSTVKRALEKLTGASSKQPMNASEVIDKMKQARPKSLEDAAGGQGSGDGNGSEKGWHCSGQAGGQEASRSLCWESEALQGHRKEIAQRLGSGALSRRYS